MSYNITGVRVNNFSIKNINNENEFIQKHVLAYSHKRINKLIDIFLINYLFLNKKEGVLNLSDFFDVYSECFNNDLCFESDGDTILLNFIDFMNNNIENEYAHFFILPEKEHCLIKIKNDNIIDSIVKTNPRYQAYSMSTSSGWSSFDELIDSGKIAKSKDDMFNQVLEDWELFTKNSFYIIENALSKKLFDYGQVFRENIESFISEESVVSRLSNLDTDIIVSYFKDFYIELNVSDDMINNHSDFLRIRKEMISSEHFKHDLIVDFKKKVNEFEDLTVKDIFNRTYKHNAMF